MEQRVGVIGLGNMGRPIAKNILRAGFPLTVFDLRREGMEEMRGLGAESASSPSELAKTSDVILLVVPDSRAVKAVLFGRQSISRGAEKGTIVVDMTTSDPRHSKPFSDRLSSRWIEYIDAPMTGGALGARTAQLLLMAGGKQEIYERCLPVFKHISKKTIYIGEVGQGHRMKLIHNHLSHATFVATCEAVTLGRTFGLSLERMIEVFNEGNARNYSTEVRFPKSILSGAYDLGATFNIVYKDISLVRKLGKRARLRLPMNDVTYRYWKYAVDKGLGEEDWSKIFQMMKELVEA